MSNYYKTAEDFDWYKYYPASFSMTTGHLSHIELGVYRRMLDHYWTSDNKLPMDAAEIAELIGEKVFNWRRYGITAPAGFDNEEVTIRIVDHILNEFFEQDEDGHWRHIWLDDYRQATDTQFKERSKQSKERAARQSRGEKGKFGKLITVTDGDSPCLTDEKTVPDGESTVDRVERPDGLDGLDQIDKTEQTEQIKRDVVPPLHENPPVTLSYEFPIEEIPPTAREQILMLQRLQKSDPEKAVSFNRACLALCAAKST